MVILVVVNQKGGVGKTTVALGLAATAGRRGIDTVVVDLDPQGNATSGMGVWSPEQSIDVALAADRPGVLAEVVRPTGWDADLFVAPPRLAPSSPSLAQREPQLATDPIGAQDRLQLALQGLDAELVIIDCPPSLGLLTVNGLFAADAAVIVTEPGAWATDGVDQILRNVARIAERRQGSPAVAGIVVNRLARTRDARYWDEQLVEAHPELVVRPAVRLRAAVAEASAQSLPIHALARDGVDEAVAEFDAVLDVLLERVGATATAPSPDLATVGSQPGEERHGAL
jgi:chromosome partitioning protein